MECFFEGKSSLFSSNAYDMYTFEHSTYAENVLHDVNLSFM